MAISSNYVQFYDLVNLILQLSVSFQILSNSFKIWGFRTHNMKVKPKGKKVNIALTHVKG